MFQVEQQPGKNSDNSKDAGTKISSGINPAEMLREQQKAMQRNSGLSQGNAEPMQMQEDEEEIQAKESPAQKQEEEEEVQAKRDTAQMMVEEEEDKKVQAKTDPTQMKEEEEEIQPKMSATQFQKEDEEIQQKKGEQNSDSPASKSVNSFAHLNMALQAKMQNSFGTSFQDVNIHQNDNSASQMGALAYTQGDNVHFAPGQFNPNTQGGQELLGHELTHVVQQRQGRVQPTKQGKGMAVNDNPSLENEADSMGKKAVNGLQADIVGGSNEIQKKEDDPEPEKYDYIQPFDLTIDFLANRLGTSKVELIKYNPVLENIVNLTPFTGMKIKIPVSKAKQNPNFKWTIDNSTQLGPQNTNETFNWNINNVEREDNKYESYKSKEFSTSKDAGLYNISSTDKGTDISSIKSEAMKYNFTKEIIPKGLKVKIIEISKSFEGKKPKFVEVVKIQVASMNKSKWDGKEVWTTRTNISKKADKSNLYTVISGSATKRNDGSPVKGKQKTITKDSNFAIKDYKHIDGIIYVLAYDPISNVDFGWIKANNIDGELANETLGIDKAEYISEEKNHSTINKNSTIIYKEENGFDYKEYMKQNDDYVRIPENSKVKILKKDNNFSEVSNENGVYLGWTHKDNYKKTDNPDLFIINNSDARIRVQNKKYTSTGKKLKVGDFVITKGLADNVKYSKIALTEKVGDKNSEKKDSEGFVLTENLTDKWADVKSDHAAWNKGRYLGQNDLINFGGRKTYKNNKGKKIELPDVDRITKKLYIEYNKLVQAAKTDGLQIKLISGFRSYPEQKRLYDLRHVRGVATASPGNSQHQNGIAIDINTNGFNTEIYNWMKKNAPKYGFIRTVNSEDWHWEYKPEDAKKHGYKMPNITKG